MKAAIPAGWCFGRAALLLERLARHVRVAVRTEADNAVLLAALEAVL